MSTLDLAAASAELTVRTITRVVPNLRNPAEEYHRQREVIYAATSNQSEKMKLWESLRSSEGWVSI